MHNSTRYLGLETIGFRVLFRKIEHFLNVHAIEKPRTTVCTVRDTPEFVLRHIRLMSPASPNLLDLRQ